MNKYYKRRFNYTYVITKTVIQHCNTISDLPVLWYNVLQSLSILTVYVLVGTLINAFSIL